jgi:hypothetical protein
MAAVEVEIAKLANLILGEPEENIEKFKEFFSFGVQAETEDGNRTADTRIRSLALLSATAVLIDIFPSFLVPLDGNDEEQEKGKKSSKEHHLKQRRAKMVQDYFDQLVQRMNKLKLVRGITTLLKSPVCSRQCLDQRRLQQLVSSAVSLAAQSGLGNEARNALRERIVYDLANHVDNLEIVKLIVLGITKEKQPTRLNLLIPIFENIRFVIPDLSSHSLQTGGAKMDRKLIKDLATGRGDFVDIKKIKSAEAHILSEVVALYIRTIRSAQTGGQYSFKTIKTCIEGLATNCISVNSDLASELEQELMGLAKFHLTKQSASEEDGLLGAIALSALLNITKGGKERAEILTGSVIGGVETLVPIALDRLLQNCDSNTEEILTGLCKGAIGLSAQFGSDKALLAVARALVTSLCVRYNDQSKLAAELLVHVAARSALVRTAIDPDGVLVDGQGLAKEEVTLFPQLSSLMGYFAPNEDLANKLLGNLSKYCRELATRVRAEAVLAGTQEDEEHRISRKKARTTKKH